MKGWLALTVGALALVLGAVWTLQGLDYLSGSRMSGQSIWAVVGPVVGIAGVSLIVIGLRLRSRQK